MNSSAWWQRVPDRFLAEDAALRDLEKDGAIDNLRWARDEDGNLVMYGALRLARGGQGFVLTFPENYPDDCPWLAPSPPARLSTHQFGTGALCLEVGPDNWHPGLGSKDVVRSAIKLLELEASSPAEIPSRHTFSTAELARAAVDSVFIEPSAFDAVLATLPASSGTFSSYLGLRGRGFQVWPVSLPGDTPLKDIPPSVRGARTTKGTFVRLKPGAPNEPPATRAELQAFVAEHGVDAPKLDEETEILLMLPEGGTYQCAIVLSKSAFPLVVVRAGLDGVAHRSPRVSGDPLVTIVGAGSLGSKMAVSLARAGVRRFVLLDPDLLLGHNVCRHEGTMLDVGRSKVSVVKERIAEVAFENVEVTALTFGVGRAESPVMSSILSLLLQRSSLLIDATAEPSAFNTLARISSDGEVPILWAEIFAGGFGGLIAWAHPRATPCARCVRRALHLRLADLPPAPRGAGAPYEGGEATPSIATDADVSFIASAACSLALSLAVGTRPEGAPLTLVGQRAGWVLDRPLSSIAWDVLRDDVECERCWKTPNAPSPELAARVDAILADADRPPQQ